jgi:hypothetical protein
MKRRPKLSELTWFRVAYSHGGTWITDEWQCHEFPDLICRVHKKKGSRKEFGQFCIRNSHGLRFADLKEAYRALMKRKAIRIGYAKSNRPRRVTRKHSSARRKARNVSKKSGRRRSRK